MNIAIADLQDALELTQIEIDGRTDSKADDVPPLETYFPLRLQRWTAYMTGQASPQQAKPDRVVLKACVDGEIIGFIAGHLTTRHDKDAEIQAIHVLKDYENVGIDQRLLLRFIAWVRQHSARSLCAEIAADSPYRETFVKYGAQQINACWIYWDDAEQLAERVRCDLLDNG